MERYQFELPLGSGVDRGLTVIGRNTVRGDWASTAVGLDGNHARIALLGVPDGSGQLELFEYLHP